MTGPQKDQPKSSILIVDDEPNLLQAIRRQLHKRFNLVLAESGDQALALMRERGPFAVIVCDMNMPGMTGIEVLAKVAEQAPDTVRIMLTGQADLTTAVDAINHGNIFRFFVKPCAAEILAAGLEAGLTASAELKRRGNGARRLPKSWDCSAMSGNSRWPPCWPPSA